MTRVLGFGKVMAALFWGALLANLLSPFAQPFAWLLNAAGTAILLMHGLELWLFNAHIQASARPWLARAQVALFGIFHLASLPEVQSAPTDDMALAVEQG